ncbi:MAG: hypothetical protein RBR81_02835 [Bacteroidales bacterium]|nr:hypothetical protein [Bacteroidales bacterium]
MKKSVAKTSNKAKKTTATVKPVRSSKGTKGTAARSRKVTTGKAEPSEIEISRKAYEIYNERIRRGENGTPADDWHKATEILRKS